jgi:hypothetical protein
MAECQCVTPVAIHKVPVGKVGRYLRYSIAEAPQRSPCTAYSVFVEGIRSFTFEEQKTIPAAEADAVIRNP